jgi:hypothetical protein
MAAGTSRGLGGPVGKRAATSLSPGPGIYIIKWDSTPAGAEGDGWVDW